jgi:hypothetical protein
MKKFALITALAIALVACTTPVGTQPPFVFSEKEGEVMLTDLVGLDFSLVCSIDGAEKKCGLVFKNFHEQYESGYCGYNVCSWGREVPGFLNASILSIQVKDENTGEVKPLISYFQEEITYLKGDSYVPSAMALNTGAPITEITLNGFYHGNEWIKRDTTIAICDTLFADKNGKLDFSVLDGWGNKIRLTMDLGAVLKRNDASTLDSRQAYKNHSAYLEFYWSVDTGLLTVDAIKKEFSQYRSELTKRDGQFLFVSPIQDELIRNGGFNKNTFSIPVVIYGN